MLYVLYGPDVEAGRKKLHELLEGVQKKRPGASLFRFTAENLQSGELQDLVKARGLFEAKHIVLLDLPFALAEGKQVVLGALPELASSENLFVLFEGACDVKTMTLLKKYADNIQVHSIAAQQKRGQAVFNRFALPDALGKRDKKNLWVLYQKALYAGLSEEEIHGLLFWQVKSMLLASGSGSADEAGLKPFVYNKARLAAAHYSQEELLGLSERLVSIYHDARRGKYGMETALERFVLGV